MFAANGMASSALGALMVEDVFSTYVYSGTGSAQSIANGIALADSPIVSAFSAFAYQGKGTAFRIRNGLNMAAGGLVWLKDRTAANTHYLRDSTSANHLSTNNTNAGSNAGATIPTLYDDGFDVGAASAVNTSGNNYIGWCFAKKEKLLDIVTWTGDGTSNRVLNHALGATVGMITTKVTSTTGDWNTYHVSATGDLALNTTAAQTASRAIITAATSTTFTVTGVANTAGATYCAYLFAHDTASDGMIQCGSFTTVGNSATVNLGWRPQFLLVKSTSASGQWGMFDTTRGWVEGTTADAALYANLSNAESTAGDFGGATATGFTYTNAADTTHIYMAIRAPETSADGGGMVWEKFRSGPSSTGSHVLTDTLRGTGKYLSTNTTNAETVSSSFGARVFTGNGYVASQYAANDLAVSWTFKRAPKFFDVVTWTGDGVANRQIPHNLGIAPGMIVVKSLSLVTSWGVYHRGAGADKYLELQGTGAAVTETAIWGNTTPTATHFTIGNYSIENQAGATYVAYLFAHDSSADGLIQCGSFTTDGSGNATVNTTWTVGAQYAMIKCTSATGDWEVYDTARTSGFSGSDARLLANLSNAEDAVTRLSASGSSVIFAGLSASATYIYTVIRAVTP